MYRPGDPAYEHFQKDYCSLENLGYKYFIPKFRAEKWDSTYWAAPFKRVSAKYVIPVSEPHDGSSMYDCTLSDWAAVKMGPHRDIVGDLAQAACAAGLHFGLSPHRAEHNYYFDNGYYICSDVNDSYARPSTALHISGKFSAKAQPKFKLALATTRKQSPTHSRIFDLPRKVPMLTRSTWPAPQMEPHRFIRSGRAPRAWGTKPST
jgi:alpha-L-fucosidase